MIRKIFHYLLLLIISAVFIYSGYSKLYPAEPFELFVFSHSFFNWLNSTIIVRLLIGIEFSIGLLLLFNIFTKRILQITVVILSIFTFYLLFIYFFDKDINDCKCFGENLILTPLQSILKNIVLIGISIYLVIKNKPFHFKYQKLVLILSIATGLTMPFILSPPDGFIDTSYKNKLTHDKIDSDIIGDFTFQNKHLSFKNGKAMVCFFSMGCKFCQMAAHKISISVTKSKSDFPIYYVFYGNKENLKIFWKNSKSKKFPYKIINTGLFFSYSGNSLPSIMFIENEKIKKHVGYRALDDKMIYDFFKESSIKK